MPAQAKIDHFLFLFVLGVLSLATLSTFYFGFKTYISDTNTGQSDNLLVLQGKSKDEGKVLSGYTACAEGAPLITIRDNAFNKTNVNAVYSSSKQKWCVDFFNQEISDITRTVLADDQSWSLTLEWARTDPVYFNNQGTYKFHLQSNQNAKGTIIAGTSSGDDSSSNTSDSSSVTSSGTTTQTTQTTTTEKETINGVTLPKTFTAKKSTTTDLAKITDLKKVKNFTLDVPGKNKIVFKDVLDLSSEKLVDKFKTLDKYVKISESGKVTIDSNNLAALNKKATITMSKLSHLFEPEILVDGKKDTEKIVSNVVYDKKTGSLTFDVGHFSTLTAATKIELLEPAVDSVENPNALIKGRVSDPDATLTARFNEQDIESILVGVESGEFTLNGLTFKEGENFLTVEATSKLGKVLPLVKTITYQPTAVAIALTNQTNYPLLIVSLIVVMIFLVLTGYLIYRKRKHHSSPNQIKAAPAV